MPYTLQIHRHRTWKGENCMASCKTNTLQTTQPHIRTCHKGVRQEKLPLRERDRGFQRLFALVPTELRGHEKPHCAVLRIDCHICNKHFLFLPVHEKREELAGRRGKKRIHRRESITARRPMAFVRTSSKGSWKSSIASARAQSREKVENL